MNAAEKKNSVARMPDVETDSVELALDMPLPDGETFSYFRGYGDYVDIWNQVVSPIGNALIQVIRYKDEDTRRLVAAEECKRISPEYRERSIEFLAHWVDNSAWENPTRNYADDYTVGMREVVEENHVRRIITSVIPIPEDSPLRRDKGITVCPIKLRNKPAVPKRKPPCSPDPSNGGDSMKTSTTPLAHFWGQALSAGGADCSRRLNGWLENTINQHPRFARANMTHGGGDAVVYFDPKNYSALELWGKVYSIDDLVLEVYTVILALMCDSRNACPPGFVKRFYINPSQILNLKSFRRWGEDRRVALRRVIDAVKLLSEWTTDYGGFPLPPDKKGKPRFAEQRGCKIFHVLSSWHLGEQGELFEKENGELEHAPVSIHCVSGSWLEHWMNSEENYCWIQSISRKLLDIPGANDAERYAKRIGMLLLGFVAGTAHINKEIRWTVRKILEDLVMLPTDEYRGLGGREGRKNEHWANRTDKALFGYLTDEVDADGNEVYEPGAFDILLEYGVLARYRKGDEDHPYPDPGCRGAGWQERWLETPVYMTTPEAAAKIATNPLPDSLTQEQVVTREKPAITGKVLRKWTRRGTGNPKKKLAIGQYLDTATAERLRVEIARHFPNQIKAAEYFGCTQSGLSRVLSRNRAPGVELAAKIKAFLDSPEG